MSEDFWMSLSRSLGIEDTSTMDEILEAADQLRAQAEVQNTTLITVDAQVARMMEVVEAAQFWYAELLRLGHYKPDEALKFSTLRSDRWLPEVDLAAATDKYNSAMNQDVVPEGEALLK